MSYFFGLGNGDVPAVLEEAVRTVAERHDAGFCAYRPFNEAPRYWFYCHNAGSPGNEAVRDAVLADLEQCGLAEDGALLMPDPDPWGRVPGQSVRPLADVEAAAKAVLEAVRQG